MGDASSLRAPKCPLKVGFEGRHRTSQVKIKYGKKQVNSSAFGLPGIYNTSALVLFSSSGSKPNKAE